jgi:hypothetical protein
LKNDWRLKDGKAAPGNPMHIELGLGAMSAEKLNSILLSGRFLKLCRSLSGSTGKGYTRTIFILLYLPGLFFACRYLINKGIDKITQTLVW